MAVIKQFVNRGNTSVPLKGAMPNISFYTQRAKPMLDQIRKKRETLETLKNIAQKREELKSQLQSNIQEKKDRLINANNFAQKAKQEADYANSFRGMATNFGKALVGNLLVDTPTKVATSLLDIPYRNAQAAKRGFSAIFRGKDANEINNSIQSAYGEQGGIKPFENYFTGTRNDTYQNEAAKRAVDIVEGKTPLWHALTPFAQVPLDVMQTAGTLGGLKQLLSAKNGEAAVAGVKNLIGLPSKPKATITKTNIATPKTIEAKIPKSSIDQGSNASKIEKLVSEGKTPRGVVETGIDNAIKKDVRLQQKVNAAVELGGTKPELKKSLSQWVKDEYTATAKAQKEALDFKIPENANNINLHETGGNYTGKDKVVAKFKELYKRANDAGLDVPERANYIPHVYKQNPKEMQNLIVKGMEKRGVDPIIIRDYLSGKELPNEVSKTLKLNPFFSKERIFNTYKDAEKWGLTPKYTNINQLVGHYTEQMEKAIANRNLITDLANKNLLTSFPNRGGVAVNIPGLRETYYAEPKIAGQINDIFRNENALNPAQSFFKYGAKFNQGIQNLVLAGGVPKTNLNFYTAGIANKNLVTGFGNVLKGDIRGAITNFKTLPNLVRSNFVAPTKKFFESRIANGITTRMAQEGIDVNHVIGSPMENNRGISDFIKNTPLKSIIGEGYDRVLNEKTFKGFIPMQKVTMFEDTFNNALRQGLDDKAAQKIAGDVVKNYDGIVNSVRGKSGQDMLGTFFFAPRFREGLINTYTNTFKAVVDPRTWGNKAYSQNRALALGMGLNALAFEALNWKLNGHSMSDNPPGKQTELMIPGENGKVYFTPWMPSQSAFIRNITEAGLAASKGDFAGMTQKAGSNLSMGLKLITDIAGNKDYFNNQIYDPQEPGLQQASDIVRYGAEGISHPYAKGAYEYSRTKSAEQNPFYPKYQEIKSLVDQGKREEAQTMIDSLNANDKKAYYDIKSMKLKDPAQILSESVELPLRFSTKGKIESQKHYALVDELERKIKSTNDETAKAQIVQDYFSKVSPEERKSITWQLTKDGLSTYQNVFKEQAKDFLRIKDLPGFKDYLRQHPDLNTKTNIYSLIREVANENKSSEQKIMEEKVKSIKKNISNQPFFK